MSKLLLGHDSRRRLPLASLLFIPIAAFAQISDTTPPVLTSWSFPASVNVTHGPQTFAITIHATDNLSGVNYAHIYFASPSGKQNHDVYAYRTGGTLLAAVLTTTATAPQYSESGNWTVSLDLYDNAGNDAHYSTAALAAAGFATTISVTSIPDTAPPTLTGVSINPASVNVSKGAQTVTVQLDESDDLSGVSFACVVINCYSYGAILVQSPSGIQYEGWGGELSVSQISGTALKGVWQLPISIPQYAEPGVWTIYGIYLEDNAGNTEWLYNNDLQTKGLTATLTVVSNPEDLAPPQLNGITLPALVDTSALSQVVQGTLALSDNLSGFAYGLVTFTSPSNGQTACSNDYCAGQTAFTLDSGTPRNGNYSFTFTMPRYSEAGTWTISGVALQDAVNNYVFLSPSDLLNLGLNGSFDVIKGTSTIDGTISAATGGTVNDQTFGSRASITVPGGLLTQNTNVAIDVLASSASPLIPTPQGYSGQGSLFMNLTLTPVPPEPFPAPGISVTIPVQEGTAAPGSHMDLYRIDTLTGHLIPELSVSGKIISGTVAADGLSATFTGLASLSTVIGLIPNGYPIGDVNKDGKVNCTDVDIVKAAFGTTKGEKGFNPEADVNNDGAVDINDLAIVLHHLPSGLVCQ